MNSNSDIMKKFGRELWRSPFIQQSIECSIMLVNLAVVIPLLLGLFFGSIWLSVTILGYDLKEIRIGSTEFFWISAIATAIAFFTIFLGKMCLEFWSAWKRAIKQ